MKENIQELRNSGLAKLEKLVATDQLSDWHRDFLGRKGELTLLLKQLGELPAEERPAAGKEVTGSNLNFRKPSTRTRTGSGSSSFSRNWIRMILTSPCREGLVRRAICI